MLLALLDDLEYDGRDTRRPVHLVGDGSIGLRDEASEAIDVERLDERRVDEVQFFAAELQLAHGARSPTRRSNTFLARSWIGIAVPSQLVGAAS